MRVLERQEAYCPPTEMVTQCPLCNSVAAEYMFPTWDRLHRLPGEFALVRCIDCELVRLSPRPVIEQLSFYYPEAEYYSYQKPARAVLSPGWRNGLRRRIRDSVLESKGYPVGDLALWQRTLQPLFIRLFRHRIPYGFGERFPRYQPQGSALEIGCGSGSFLGVLKHHGWQVAGIELSEAAAAVAKRELDIDVFVGPLQEAPFASASFDYVHMSHVIEHIPDPVGALRTVAQLLKPGGMLYIETPNVDSFGRRRSGRYWFPWDSPRHLCLFTPAHLRRAINDAGLITKRLRTVVETHYDWEALYRREDQEQRKLPDHPQLPNNPHLSFASRCRFQLLTLVARLRHLFRPFNGDILMCWATRD